MSERIEKALAMASKAHEGQFDKSGKPYINHPITVSEGVESEDEKIAALLHDTVEDTDLTLDEIRQAFGDIVADAVDLLTHPEDMPYMDYIKRLSANPIARAVKLSDLHHNMDLSRLPSKTEKDYRRLEKYRRAEELLMDEI